MDYLYLLIKFCVAGFIIVGVTVIVQQVHPTYGGILAAAPITTTLAFIITNHEAGQDITRELVLGSFLFAIPTLCFLLILYVLLERFSFLPSLAGSLIAWLAGIILMQRHVSG